MEWVLCTEVVVGHPAVRSEGKGYPSFDSEYTAILDLTNRREIDAVGILNTFIYIILCLISRFECEVEPSTRAVFRSLASVLTRSGSLTFSSGRLPPPPLLLWQLLLLPLPANGANAEPTQPGKLTADSGRVEA